ncbi:MAG TPA: hypothetical protein VJL58_06385 [Pyrinomonadaceae bacterium]|nr:hypothetical protein [Pyrinomonadaceae bacterium]
MVNRTDKITAREKRSDPKARASAASTNPRKDVPQNDDLILSLSDAYENKRAQQVSEWQSLQPMVMRRAA